MNCSRRDGRARDQSGIKANTMSRCSGLDWGGDDGESRDTPKSFSSVKLLKGEMIVFTWP